MADRPYWKTTPRFGEPGKVLLRLDTGRQVLVPESALLQEGGGYRLPFTAAELAGGAFGTDVGEQTQILSRPLTESGEGTVTVPLMEETLRVTKQRGRDRRRPADQAGHGARRDRG